MLLFGTEWIFTPKDECTHQHFDFSVPNGLNALQIKFEYSPKYLENEEQKAVLLRKAYARYMDGAVPTDDYIRSETVGNFITLSLDSPDGWVGTAHRHPPKQTITISADDCTRGFIPTRIKEGQWRLTLSVFAVITETCTMNISVEGV